MDTDLDTQTKVKENGARPKGRRAKKSPGGRTTAASVKKPQKVVLAKDQEALKKIKLVAVAYSSVEREWFSTEAAYHAELEVENRAMEVIASLEQLGIPAKGYRGDQYFLTNLLIDRPDLVLNLVDTLRGRDALQISVPAALELSNTPYTGAGLTGLVIGNDRNLVKQLMLANSIPTPPFQLIRRRGTQVEERLSTPLIVKLNESGGSVGIDNLAVMETRELAEKRADEMIGTYRMPVMVEEFVDGLEITVVVFEDFRKRHVFLGQKVFGFMPDGKHSFTSLESYGKKDSYHYKLLEDDVLAREVARYAEQAFVALHNHDYAKFDVRVDADKGNPYFIDANPNTAFGPSLGLPFTEVLALNGVAFSDVLASLISKYARRI